MVKATDAIDECLEALQRLLVIAILVEATRSLDRALGLGLIRDLSAAHLRVLKAIVPVNRGGACSHPDGQAAWEGLVTAALAQPIGRKLMFKVKQDFECVAARDPIQYALS